MRAQALLIALTLLGIFHGAVAHADQVSGLRSAELTEVDHQITVTMHPGYAELVVQRTVFNPGPRHDQATFELYLPDGAVAVGLRTLGSKNGKPHWFEGELLEAEEAARRYKELTGIGGAYPKDPALLSWRWMSHLKLQVFPCPPQARKSIEYTLHVPTTYYDGLHHLTLSDLGTSQRRPDVKLGQLARGAHVEADGMSIPTNGRLPVTDDGNLELEYRQPQSDIRLELARADTDAGRTVQHVEVQVGTLSSVPQKVDIVIALDRSHSMVDEAYEGMLRAAAAYVAHAPHARVQLISFGRTARTEFPNFVSATQALAQLKVTKLQGTNGTEIEGALELAGQQLANSPPHRSKRLLLLTDALTSSHVNVERLTGLSRRTGALVHIGLVEQVDQPKITFAEYHPWRPIAERTGGLAWETTLPNHLSSEKENRAIFEEWMRPLRLHQVTIGINMFKPLAIFRELAEGEGLSELSLDEPTNEPLYLRGKLWATPLTRAVGVDQKASTRWAGLVFGSYVHQELEESEMFVLAKRSGAVSPVTSLLAIEPGVRPSTEGLDHTASGVGRGAGFGQARLPRGLNRRFKNFNHPQYLEEMVNKLWDSCGGQGPVRVDMETTRDEIVSVRNVHTTSKYYPVTNRVALACLTEAIWNERLPNAFTNDFDSFRVAANYL